MIHLKTIAIILIMGFILVGCGGEKPEPEIAEAEPTEEATDVPEATAIVAATNTPLSTDTPTLEPTVEVVPTETTAPTDTPEPTPTEEMMMEPLGPVTVETLVEELDSATGAVAVDAEGNVYMADIGAVPGRMGETVYKITPEGEVSVFASGRGAVGRVGQCL